MVGLTKRKVQLGRRDFEGGGGTERSLGQNTETLQKQLYRHYNETSHLNVQWRHSLTRISLGLSAILTYRMYRQWGDTSTTNANTSSSWPSFLQMHGVEFLGVISGLAIAHYIHSPLPLTGGSYVLPWSFYAAFLCACLEIFAFYRHVVSNPEYTLHIDATLPVGALFFLFVWGADLMMGRSQREARLGLEASQRLGETVAPHRMKRE
ncbi:hypothetical protein Naga_100265g5 [Nannochloropsis gaditana]|uniref:Transmembrane protein n=1 Tax=Nannochloropsis gaditana TaxID=72520 RepID=W7TMY4_9STRA|nr:hypothetical protein Naga_100265g5 [Nannochloropsis gaditana]